MCEKCGLENLAQHRQASRRNAIRQNVIDTVAKLKSATPILSAAVEQRKLKVVGGIYRLRDGRVDMIA
jgi:carbonic anhydrase